MKEKDWSKENPQLHLLYVKWAVQHLFEIDKCIKKLDNFSNLNMLDIVEAMILEKQKLISNNTAYADAFEILESINEDKGEE